MKIRGRGLRTNPPGPRGNGPATLVVLGILALLVPWARAQDRVSTDETLAKLRELHHAEAQSVRLVLLPVAVTDRRGRAVREMKPEDFRLFEDWIPQDVRFLSSEATEPISIAFLLDLSGSMRQTGKLDEAKDAIRRFVEALRPADRFGLIGFADDQVTWITEFTSDRETFLARLEVQRAYGQTALYDAVAATPDMVDSGTTGRKAIVLITDGVDNASKMTTFHAVQVARRVDVPIYSVGLSSLPPKLLAKGSVETVHRILELFADETGGRMFTVHRAGELADAVARIDEELRSAYVMGYSPTRVRWDGAFRRIKLETTRNGLRVRTRRGYYASP